MFGGGEASLAVLICNRAGPSKDCLLCQVSARLGLHRVRIWWQEDTNMGICQGKMEIYSLHEGAQWRFFYLSFLLLFVLKCTIVSGVCCLAFDPTNDNRILMSGSLDKSIRIWDTHRHKHLKTIPNAHKVASHTVKPNLLNCSSVGHIRFTIWLPVG